MKRILLACWLVGSSACVHAQPQQSENFQITKSVLDAGGGASNSENFQLISAFGQPTPIGVASSESFTLHAGFLTPEFGVAPLSPIQDLVIQRAPASTDIQLDWSVVDGATEYTIYRDADPNFVPGPANQLGTSATNSFTDAGAVSLPAIKYYYNVTAGTSNSPTAIHSPNNVKRRSQAGKQ